MNVFEDLIEELKGENLLENTVVESNPRLKTVDNKFNESSKTTALNNDVVLAADYIEPEIIEVGIDSIVEYSEQNEQPARQEVSPAVIQNVRFDETAASDVSEFNTVIPNEKQNNGFKQEEQEKPKKPVNEVEFFRSRATNEVLALQMVEHVLAGVEREILNLVPKLYDELPVKKSLHDFLQISGKSNAPEHAQAEFQLMQETESWYSALSHRDKNIKVGNQRRFCENSRPALSLQALTSMARFYRNAPYSEAVRSKFDLILTRLFSREVGRGKRLLTHNHDQLIEKISGLYAEWSSIPLYSAEEDDSGIVLAAMKVEDFMTEADNAVSFEELVKSDFFNRLRVFKESTQESFFAPLLAASVVESNIRIGNRYTELFEKENGNAETLEEKYGALHEQTISEVICKTLEIKDILNEQAPEPIKLESKKITPAQIETTKTENPILKAAVESKDKQVNKLFKVNKWLLALTIITLLGTFGLYIWVEAVSKDTDFSPNVKNVNLDNSSLKEHIQTARISGDTFYGIVLPSWEGLAREKKEELLSKVLLIGNEKGFLRVNLIDRRGKTVGFASPEKVEVSNP